MSLSSSVAGLVGVVGERRSPWPAARRSRPSAAAPRRRCSGSLMMLASGVRRELRRARPGRRRPAGPSVRRSGNAARIRPAREMSRVSTSTPAAPAKAWTIGRKRVGGQRRGLVGLGVDDRGHRVGLLGLGGYLDIKRTLRDSRSGDTPWWRSRGERRERARTMSGAGSSDGPRIFGRPTGVVAGSRRRSTARRPVRPTTLDRDFPFAASANARAGVGWGHRSDSGPVRMGGPPEAVTDCQRQRTA